MQIMCAFYGFLVLCSFVGLCYMIGSTQSVRKLRLDEEELNATLSRIFAGLLVTIVSVLCCVVVGIVCIIFYQIGCFIHSLA